MKIVWIFLVNFSSSFLCSSTKKSIEFDNDGSFKILQLSDLHLGTELGKDVNTFDFINKLIDEIKPDLVANTGDTISGEYGSNYVEFFRNNWKKLSEIFIKKQQNYFYTLGNHDDLAELNRAEIIQLDMINPYSLSDFTPGLTGGSNYYVKVYQTSYHDFPVLYLWSFDSGRLGCDGQKWGYGCVERDIVEWFKREISLIQKANLGQNYHIAFVHIPFPELIEVYNSEFYGQSTGKVGCPIINTGLFDALRDAGVKNIFFGHLHDDCYCGKYKEVEMCLARKTGYGGTGNLKRGTRVIDIKLENEGLRVDTFVIDDDFIYDRNKTLQSIPGPKQDRCHIPAYQYEMESKTKQSYKIKTIVITFLVCIFVLILGSRQYSRRKRANELKSTKFEMIEYKEENSALEIQNSQILLMQ